MALKVDSKNSHLIIQLKIQLQSVKEVKQIQRQN